VKLTEDEFRQACSFIAALGKKTTETHNEVVLLAGSLGFSTLVCLLNNGDKGRTETTANLLGPFWRMNSPLMKNGESIVRSPTPGPALFVGITAATASLTRKWTYGNPRRKDSTRIRIPNRLT
jgi:catechol 1,2-dioxygenase